MSELTHRSRPEPASPELAERATAPRTLADEIASEIGYWAPETLYATVGGGVAAFWLHPAALPIAGVLLAARITVHKLRERHKRREKSERVYAEFQKVLARQAEMDVEDAAERQASGQEVRGA